jgi:hypothetical protein
MNDNIFGEKKNKSSGRSEGQDKAGLFIEELINETVVIFGIGISFLFHLLIRKPLLCLLWLAVVLATVYLICHFKLHLHFLIYIAPELKGTSILFWIKKRTFATQYTTILLLLVSGVSLALGVKLRFTRTKYQKIFKAVGLTNKLGDCPALVKAKKLDSQRVELIFDAKSVGKARFEAAADDLETAFGRSIESFSHGTNQRFISMILTQKKLPSYVAFEELASQTKLKPYSFYVGRALEGVVQQSVIELPHMLIAGTTGAGKSCFFKQTLVGLLQSSPHLQMYLIDLKGGLEMVDFKDAPNVCVIKSMKEAVYILRKVRLEMQSRFRFLEQNNLKSVDPERDKKDRIVVAVDEASVLYMKRDKEDEEHGYATECRKITDDLSKLSRAAAIHLILATQKV